jgi:hypothetical protein
MRRPLASLSPSVYFLGERRWRPADVIRAANSPMTLSQTEINAIVKAAADSGATSARSSWVGEMRRMLRGLADLDFQGGRATPLVKLCEAGARYGWQTFEAKTNSKLLELVSSKARSRLRRDLRLGLQRLTRPCLELGRTSFGFALNSIGVIQRPMEPKLVDRMFLGKKPRDRLFPLFKEFPILARLWSQVISRWRTHNTEVLARFATDRFALSRAFFGGQPVRTIVDLRCGLSDSHNNGRTVVQLQFEAGSVIYKPRSGSGESEWFSLLNWMNSKSFQPNLRAARVLRRKGYCWMEYVELSSCENKRAARRFYERLGGTIAAVYLLKAVDCHRDNFIASSDQPVLVDVDALWHVSRLTKTQSPRAILYRTGFFPNANRHSLQSRSSVLGWTSTGKHLARIGGKPLDAALYQREIVRGFAKAWHCLLGTPRRRAALLRRLRRIRTQDRRWIYSATAQYAAIRQASLQPAVLRDAMERRHVIARLCRRETASSAVLRAEINALERLDIPYFVRRIQEQLSPDNDKLPQELIRAIQDIFYLRRISGNPTA